MNNMHKEYSLIVIRGFVFAAILVGIIAGISALGDVMRLMTSSWFFKIILFIVLAVIVQQGISLLFYRGDSADKIEEEISSAQMQRTGEKIQLLYDIGKPDRNGRYSPEKMALWEKYKHLDALDKKATREERERLVRARGGYIDE